MVTATRSENATLEEDTSLFLTVREGRKEMKGILSSRAPATAVPGSKLSSNVNI
jgi:hypothetical protein